MATPRLKTVEYWFPLYTSTVADNTDTNLSQITIYIPESGVTFRSAVLDVAYHEIDTTWTGNIDRQQLSLRLGAASYSTFNITTANHIATGGEVRCFHLAGDFTSHFTSNWSGTSMTCDARVLFDTDLATPLGFTNVSARLTITYEYDADSATHLKTVWIPLDAPTGELAASKPGTPTSTIPQLTGSGSPYLPENSPTIRQVVAVVQGNTGTNSATDRSFSMELGTAGELTTAVYEHGSTVDMFTRFHQVLSGTWTAANDWYLWTSAAGAGHPQAWLCVTYEFTVSGTTTMLNSLLVPLEMAGPAGGTTSSDYQRGVGDFWIEEPATITTRRVAAFMFWSCATQVSGINMRLGTGSFVGYADDFSVLAGGVAAMIRNDSAYTLARGKNVLTVDVYRTDTIDLMWGIGGFVMVNYTSGVPTGGPGAANHTVLWPIMTHHTTAVTGTHVVTPNPPVIPESSYFLSSLGLLIYWMHASSASVSRITAGVERLVAEGGVQWDLVYSEPMDGDPEPGWQVQCARSRHLFKRWPGDPDTDRMDIETSRRWRLITYTFSYLFAQMMITYHTITYTVSGAVSGYADADGAGLTVEIWRNGTPPDKVAGVTTTTGGNYSATVYDNTLTHFATCREDSTHVGRSDNVTPS